MSVGLPLKPDERGVERTSLDAVRSAAFDALDAPLQAQHQRPRAGIEGVLPGGLVLEGHEAARVLRGHVVGGVAGLP